VNRALLRDLLLIALLGAATLLPFLGQTHYVSSHEIRHAEIGREMAVSGDFLIPTLLGQPYRDKLPLTSAAIALLFRSAPEPSMALARLPSAIAAIAGAIALYGLGRALTEPHAARLAALGVLGVAGYHQLARTARPDMAFTASMILACLALMRALGGSRRRGGWLALAGGACAAGSFLKGPLAWLFCGVFAAVAWWFGDRSRPLRLRDGALFALGFVAAAGSWVVPVLLRGQGAYLWSFLTQPDMTTWHLADTVRRFHWPWVYGLVEFLPLTLVLPIAALDARRRGLGAPLAIALAMLVVLSIIPKKRMHYQTPVFPFLALAVADAAARAADRRWWRAAQGVAALGLLAGPLYWGPVLRTLRPGEDAESLVARRILEHVRPTAPIICFGDMAERLAFVGRREGVTKVGDARALARKIRRGGPNTAVVLPKRAGPPPAGLRPVGEAESPGQSWRIYRMDLPVASE
jgi:4-amino-4-deoxy-L-arabinose transferase-like glycosyltransferase